MGAQPTPADLLVCDFCRDPEVAWDYPGDDFSETMVINGHRFTYMSTGGGWLACSACHDLIEAGDRKGLCDRTMADLGPVHGALEAALREDALHLHALFFSHRTGPAQPVRN